MKHFFTLAMALGLTIGAFAQTMVTLTVDMTNEIVSADGVHVAGNFQGWDPAATPMTDNMDGTWSYSFSSDTATTLQYKFINGNAWGADESIPGACAYDGNRQIMVDGAISDVSSTVCYNSCAACGMTTVRFRVDMSNEEVSQFGVHVAGDFQGWDPAGTELMDEDGDMVYETVQSFDAPGMSEIQYKFINGNTWADPNEWNDGACSNEYGNRVLMLDSENILLAADATGGAYCYNSCTACIPPLVVTFTVDMSVVSSVSPQGVHLAGSFQGWDPAGTPLVDNGDGTWSVSLEVSPGTYEFKFINGNAWDGNEENMYGSGCNNGGNRIATFDEMNNIYTVCWNECVECNEDPSFGCTDPAACNWMAEANLDDGNSCIYASPGLDCDGSCLLDADGDGVCDPIFGCTHEMACNYDSSFTSDDGSCVFADDDCEECTDDGDVWLLDADGDGVCDQDEIEGCMDPTSCNYDPEATDSDGSCLSVNCEPWLELEAVAFHEEGELAGMTTYRVYLNTPGTNDFLVACFGDDQNPLYLNSTSEPAWFQHELASTAFATDVNPAFFDVFPELVYDSWFTIGAEDNTAMVDVAWLADPANDAFEDFENGNNVVAESSVGCVWFVPPTPNSEEALSGEDQRILVAQLTTSGEVSGQIGVQLQLDSNPFNVFMEALPIVNPCEGQGYVDENANGLCDAFEVDGCTDPTACNYDVMATIDDDSCVFPEPPYDCGGECQDFDEDGVCDFLEAFGCTDEDACNFDVAAAFDDGSCQYLDALGVCDGDCLADNDGDGFCDEASLLITQPFTSPEEYVTEVLLGDGVTATNITYTGGLSQLGVLENGASVFSLDAGLMLNTDNALCDDFCADCLGGGVDPDLLDVANSVPPLIGQSFSVSSVNDLCILEFDFVAGGDSISFNYVFGSDEYLTYVNTTYNDIFAFFLSGPGITGPYASPAGFPDGAVNIAQVPNSDPPLPVTISSVNNVTNAAYYINNPSQQGICTNGYTTTFTAAAAVQCGETYHIKLAIADGSDTALESFVVLEAGSFSSNVVDALGVCGGNCAADLDGDGLCDLVVGCTYPVAINFDPEANVDDGSCEFADGSSPTACGEGTFFDVNLQLCVSLLSADLNLDGCVGMADLLELLAQFGLCTEVEEGCMDPNACNYVDTATVEDGSCLTLDECGVCGGEGAVFECGCADIPEGDCDCDGNALDECGVCGGTGIPEGQCDCDGTLIDALGMCGGNCASDVNSNGICDDEDIYGCTVEIACNYLADATVYDDSCEYLSCLVFDCTNPQACNYNPLADFDDGSCEFTSCAGCTLEGACNYNPEATISSGCDFITCGSCEGWVEEGGDPCDAVCSGDLDANGICDAIQIYGCMDPQAVNFNPEANVDNGTCISVSVFGCVIPFACNYDPAATAYLPGACDFSCLYSMPLSGK